MTRGTKKRHTERQRMVENQIAGRGVRDEAVLDAMRSVPREQFVAPSTVEFAYEDAALPIEADQTISQPYVVAIMLERLKLQPTDRVLEVGTGSGYAAAVLSRIAARVFTVERHYSLAEAAERQLRDSGYENVDVLHADGMLGWPEHAPFDAILVSAGGRDVPPALLEQLAPGGRLVMPVGPSDRQELVLFEKDGDGSISKRRFGAVRFVPLLGSATGAPEGSESEDEGSPRASVTERPDPRTRSTDAVDLVRRHADAFGGLDEVDLSAVAERLAGHRTVLLGEASHGTSEFYTLRAQITRRLIEEGEIDFVAVEADWPDAAHLDRFVRGLDDATAEAELEPFDRFPRWMWANEETLSFVRWLRDFNRTIDAPADRVGFFGLDLYSLHTSISAVVAYLESVDPDVARLARQRYGCLNPWERDPLTYGRLASSGRLEECEDEVVAMLQDLLEQRVAYERDRPYPYMAALQNARLVVDAERYYRSMYQSPSASWNLRDQHMFDTLLDLLSYHGPDASAAVWAHNSHLGDASATDMGARGQHNIGQLCRQEFGMGCYSVGMGTHRGTVMAAHDWDDPGEVFDVRPSLEGSYERLSHDSEMPGFLLPLRQGRELRRALSRERLERAIGVVYRPETERASHYFHAVLPRQFDEWIFLDRTHAVTPLSARVGAERGDVEDEVPETYPFAV